MRVFVLGKPGGVTHWTEDCLAGFQTAGHQTALGVTRNPRVNAAIERLLMAPWTGGLPVRRVLAAIRAFRPDLILAVRALDTPLPLLAGVAAMPARPPLIGWVGDTFSAAARPVADLFDALAYTDTGLAARHRDLGFRPPASYLPHAANPRLDAGAPAPASRRMLLAFVANPTAHRRAILAAMTQQVALFGPAWTAPTDALGASVGHIIQARRVGVEELAGIYRSHLGVLNIHHEGNVLAGLNQRHFDPCLAATPVLTDRQPDLPLCFEPGREMLVWDDPETLNGLHGRMLREPAWALAIGEAGRRRVLAEHLYGHRLAALVRLV
jgi:spore maturation protein CgeB